MQAGGVQVDLLFMLSGFLLTYKLLMNHAKGKGRSSLLDYIFKRALRLLPPIIVVSMLGMWIGDTWDIDKDRDDYQPIWVRCAAMYTFVLNYVPASLYGSFTLSLCWSLCVDMHSGIIINLLVSVLKKFSGRLDAYMLRRVFFVWLVVSLATRAYLFEENSLNIFRLGQYSHFGLLMTDNSRKWIEQRFDHTWLTSNSAKELAQTYIDNMYNPTHTRYGPFAVGGILGCNLFLANLSTGEKRKGNGKGVSWWYRAQGWFWTLNSVIMLAIPCLPSDDNAPIEAQFFATAALRTIAAASGAYLLYTAPPHRG
jgi:peptidoglycan/LPS O-acetylase OafA/YrhL